MIPLAWSGGFQDTRTRSDPAAMALISDGIPGTEKYISPLCTNFLTHPLTQQQQKQMRNNSAMYVCIFQGIYIAPLQSHF